MRPVEIRFGELTGILQRQAKARALLVLGHGAGAGMRHPFMEGVTDKLAEREIATFRYQFPYMEEGRKRPDRPQVLVQAVRAAVDAAAKAAPDLPLLAGGKSLGGRMTSTAASEAPLPRVKGLVFLGFPLHAPGRDGIERAAHLDKVTVPMLFLQGTRDRLARMDLIEQVCGGLGDRATLHVVEGGDHSFKVPKRAGRTEAEVWAELAQAVADWLPPLISRE